jgi:hypothetical protein
MGYFGHILSKPVSICVLKLKTLNNTTVRLLSSRKANSAPVGHQF